MSVKEEEFAHQPAVNPKDRKFYFSPYQNHDFPQNPE
jgi:hypothetical protein